MSILFKHKTSQICKPQVGSLKLAGYLFAGLGLVGLTGGCSSSDNNAAFVPAMSLSVELAATKELNVFDDGQSRPVIVRIYQLADAGSFQKSGFIALYESDKSVLSDSLIDTTVMPPVLPGEQRTFQLDLQQQAKFIGVLAEFSNYESASPKAFTALVESPEETPLIIRLSSNKVEVSQPVEDAWWKF
ncbi:type VI secretion system lipoprotein TssJ [Photobacterium sp. BZF1]|uniref:type VI secretion system lipoprotein TssJ n=1 Tax=Photobacterium sp. BZF1 TaxID=1904457 RepID=UPI00165378AE|nr:type VI secretion system lipoprotein TssJ [Photobacterium sp. BZF1]MBC7004885.1 type VI secretion system lipoprotein TssJ [Photobacterium sp. BZF1]